MTVRPIVITGEPVLHRRAEPVERFDDDLRELVADMFETMDAAPRRGRGAPPNGVGRRGLTGAMDTADGVAARGAIVNPYVTSTKPSLDEPDPHDEAEGCLSVPGESFPLKRGDRATVTGYDVDGTELSFEASGWFARCMQHEYDHLNGFLYVDRLNERWGRKARKAVKKQGWGKPGFTWHPGVDPDPFGHDEDHDHEHDL